eukprot:Clim_evm31s3 gene=Clim_evmTU31s3
MFDRIRSALLGKGSPKRQLQEPEQVRSPRTTVYSRRNKSYTGQIDTSSGVLVESRSPARSPANAPSSPARQYSTIKEERSPGHSIGSAHSSGVKPLNLSAASGSRSDGSGPRYPRSGLRQSPVGVAKSYPGVARQLEWKDGQEFEPEMKSADRDAFERTVSEAPSFGTDSDLREDRGRDSIPSGWRSVIFANIILTNIFVNYDAGAIAASLTELQEYYSLGLAAAGLLGSLVYLGLVLASVFAGLTLQRFNPKRVIAISMVLNLLSNLLFAAAPDIWTLELSRLFVGASQAPVVIYTPVWVDEFAPADRCTLWMSLLQAGVPLGVMLGYVVAGLVSAYSDASVRLPFFLQVGFLCVPVAIIFITPAKYLDIRAEIPGDGKETDPERQPLLAPVSPRSPGRQRPSITVTDTRSKRNSIGAPQEVSGSRRVIRGARSSSRVSEPNGDISSNPVIGDGRRSVSHDPHAEIAGRRPSFGGMQSVDNADLASRSVDGPRIDVLPDPNPTHIWAQMQLLASRRVYLFMTSALCSLYFVVTGIQLWITEYLEKFIGVEKSLVVYAFAFTSATAPIIGVIFGGWFVDYLGGYQKGLIVPCKVSMIFGLAAVICGVPSVFMKDFWIIMVQVWLLLFFGGAIIPPATGCLLACVPRSMRSFASSASMLMYNCLGFFAGPFLSGIAAQLGGGVQWGYRLIMFWSFFGLVGAAGAYFSAKREERRQKAAATDPDRPQHRLRPYILDHDQSAAGQVEVNSEDLDYELARSGANKTVPVLPRKYSRRITEGAYVASSSLPRPDSLTSSHSSTENMLVKSSPRRNKDAKGKGTSARGSLE